jgi:hypothetical protein
MIELAEALLNSRHHEVAHVLALDPFGSGDWPVASRSQQSRAKATRTFSALSQVISKPSEHQRRFDFATAICRRGGVLHEAGMPAKEKPMNAHDAVDPACD